MADWATIEHITLRGGLRDGEHLKDVGASGLVAVTSAQSGAGAVVRYRKTDEYDQLRGEHMVEPYSRIWFYDWLPDPEAMPDSH